MRPGVRCLPIMLAMCVRNAAPARAQTTSPLSGSQLEDAVEAATSDGLSRELRPTPIARSHRSALLICPTNVLTADCRFVRAVTIIWVGQTKRTVAGELSMLVHVNWPSDARGNAGQFAGYSVEVVVSKDRAGR